MENLILGQIKQQITLNQVSSVTKDQISHFFFEKDKNYILKEAQVAIRHTLILKLYNCIVKSYGVQFNPLGLIDNTVQEILDFELKDTSNLEGIYENLAAIYRYKYGDVQLEILWDGRSHLDKYAEDWTKIYMQWLDHLAQNRSFIKGVLHLTVFKDDSKNTFFINNSLKAIINEFFDLKVLKVKGLKRVYIKVPDALKAS